MKKESIAKEIVFLFIGFLLLIALIVCVYVISLDREYVQTTASVTEVIESEDKVIYTYIVRGEEYECKAKRNGSNVGDRVRLYYHSDNYKKAKLNKTSKLIFLLLHSYLQYHDQVFHIHIFHVTLYINLLKQV